VNTYHYYTDLLSPALKAKLLLYMNKTWITRVPHFQGAPQDFIVQVAVILTRHLFPPRELIIRSATMPREVFIVNKGIAAGNNQLFTVHTFSAHPPDVHTHRRHLALTGRHTPCRSSQWSSRCGAHSGGGRGAETDAQVGQLIGSDALVQTYKARTYSARAITYIECSRLDREQLFQVLESWPDMRKRFRLLAIKVRPACVDGRTHHTSRWRMGVVLTRGWAHDRAFSARRSRRTAWRCGR